MVVQSIFSYSVASGVSSGKKLINKFELTKDDYQKKDISAVSKLKWSAKIEAVH